MPYEFTLSYNCDAEFQSRNVYVHTHSHDTAHAYAPAYDYSHNHTWHCVSIERNKPCLYSN